MSCEFEPRVSLLIDGELPAAERTSVEAHLRDCAGCRQLRRDFGEVGETIRTHQPKPERSAAEALDAIVRTQRAGFWNRRVTVPLPVAAAATVALIALGTWATLQQVTPRPQAVPASSEVAASAPVQNLLDRYDHGQPAVLYKVRHGDR